MILAAGLSPMCPRPRKRTTAEYHQIDVRALHRKGYLRPGSQFAVQSSRGQEVGIIAGSAERDSLVLLGVAEPGGEVHPGQIIKVAWTSCHYGGMRPWFMCPSQNCALRAAILYDTG